MIKKYKNFNNPEVKEMWDDNGQKRYEIWILNGDYHREGGPAFQQWYETGQKMIEGWWLNNLYHREDGPSFQKWNKNREKIFEYWFLNGKEYTREKWLEKLKEIGSIHYEEQLAIYNAEKYNI